MTWAEIIEKQNVALAWWSASMCLGISTIVAADLRRPCTGTTGAEREGRARQPERPDGQGPQTSRRARRTAPAEVALLASVFVVAACGLVYELAAGALASYLLGDSVLQFSTVIGTYLFAMGIGSWLSRFLERQLVAHFLRIELLVGLIGGLLPAALFAAHSCCRPRQAPFRVAAVRAGAGWSACWSGWRSRW